MHVSATIYLCKNQPKNETLENRYATILEINMKDGIP
jgi:hypothetical protein